MTLVLTKTPETDAYDMTGFYFSVRGESCMLEMWMGKQAQAGTDGFPLHRLPRWASGQDYHIDTGGSRKAHPLFVF